MFLSRVTVFAALLLTIFGTSLDGKWSPWSPWSDCDVTCENGTQMRIRSCTNPAPQDGGLDCPGEKNKKIRSCQKKMCPVHGGWSEWDDWGTCSATCGVGMQSKRRSCNNPLPNIHGYPCFGDSVDFRLCYPGLCAIDGNWSQWSPWSDCDVTCENGTQFRTRSCSNPAPQYGGLVCLGGSKEIRSCQKEMCPVHGGWSEWEDWGTCSATCGVGMQSKTRSCNNPSPNIHGYPCFGEGLDFRLCYPGLCASVWAEWQSWSKCTGDREEGVRTRIRSCLNPSRFMSARNCQGNAIQIGSCKCNYDCYDVLKNEDDPKSGVYNVTLWKSKKTIQVYCDMETDGGGWTVFQYRYNGYIDFYRNFTEYEEGFGSLMTEFWLGLKNVQEMASQGKTELRIDISAADGTSAYENFQNFYLDEGSYYTLRIDHGTGTAGDGFTGLSFNSGRKFSTYDMDRDTASANCAVLHHGAWWYQECSYVNLNAEYVTPGTIRPGNAYGGITYYSYKQKESLKMTKLMFRRI